MNLPAVRSREVIEGVIAAPPADAEFRPAGRRAGQAIGRNASYVVGGAALVTKRLWDSRTTARYERWIRAAEKAGNFELMLQLEERLERFRTNRHQRRMDILELPVRIALAIPKIGGGALAILAAIGTLLAIATQDIAEIIVPVIIVARICMWVAIAFSVSWGPILLALPWLVLAALWAVGRAAAGSGAAPVRWSATAAAPDMDVSIDETTISRALDALRIPQISGYLKEGVPLQYLVPCRRDGRGTHAVIRLPAGVTADRIGRRRGDLATGLYRLAKEVWPTTGDEAGVLDLWIADKGALAEGAGPYPLLDGGFTDA